MGWATAQVCDACWAKRNPDGRVPYRLVEAERDRERCALCRNWTESGIYLRVETIDWDHPFVIR